MYVRACTSMHSMYSCTVCPIQVIMSGICYIIILFYIDLLYNVIIGFLLSAPGSRKLVVAYRPTRHETIIFSKWVRASSACKSTNTSPLLMGLCLRGVFCKIINFYKLTCANKDNNSCAIKSNKSCATSLVSKLLSRIRHVPTCRMLWAIKPNKSWAKKLYKSCDEKSNKSCATKWN